MTDFVAATAAISQLYRSLGVQIATARKKRGTSRPIPESRTPHVSLKRRSA